MKESLRIIVAALEERKIYAGINTAVTSNVSEISVKESGKTVEKAAVHT